MAATFAIIPSVEAVSWKSPQAEFKTGNYMVTLTELPAAAYTGTIKGFARTNPAAGGTSTSIPPPR